MVPAASIEHGWSRNVLTHHISTQLREREGKALTNFYRTLPAEDSDLTQQILKDPYSFEFLTLSSAPKSGGCSFRHRVVVLLRLHVRLHVLCRHQAHVMPLFPQSTAEKMRPSAGLHANQALAKVRRKAQQLSP